MMTIVVVIECCLVLLELRCFPYMFPLMIKGEIVIINVDDTNLGECP